MSENITRDDVIFTFKFASKVWSNATKAEKKRHAAKLLKQISTFSTVEELAQTITERKLPIDK